MEMRLRKHISGVYRQVIVISIGNIKFLNRAFGFEIASDSPPYLESTSYKTFRVRSGILCGGHYAIVIIYQGPTSSQLFINHPVVRPSRPTEEHLHKPGVRESLMDEPQSSQDGVPKSKFTYRHLNALSSSTPPKDSPLRYLNYLIFLTVDVWC